MFLQNGVKCDGDRIIPKPVWERGILWLLSWQSTLISMSGFVARYCTMTIDTGSRPCVVFDSIATLGKCKNNEI